MSILVNSETRLIVQGITGREGSFHAGQMVEYGTNVVGGVTPGGAGKEVHGVLVFNTVQDAVDATKANTSIIYVPAPFAPVARPHRPSPAQLHPGQLAAVTRTRAPAAGPGSPALG